MLTVKFICLLGSISAFAHALAIPNAQNGALLRRNGIVNDPLLLVQLDKRANPAKLKPTGGPAAKPAPAPKPPAKATPKVTPTPAAKPVAWPDVKIPYITTAIDTCGVLADCDESHNEGEEIVARAFTNAHITHDVLVPRPTPAPIRRDIRTYKPKGAKLTIKNLDYPGAPDLFSPPKGANVMVNVFDYNSPNNGDYKVKNMRAKPASYDGYVTEHIVELQTIMLFVNSVAKTNPKIKSFVETWWNKELDPATVASRPNKPLITMGDQKTINNLVFEALGSNNNREDFVLCEEEINGYKARLWNTKNPMAVSKYKKAVIDAVSGGTDSSLYLSALRSTLAVFEYLKDPAIKSRLQNSIKNVGLELENIEHLTKEKIDLATPWQTYMKSHLLNIETKAKVGIKARIEIDTENQLTKMIADLKSKEADLRKKETGKNKVALDQKAKVASDRLDKEIKTAEAAVAAQENVLKSKEADLKAKRALYNTKNAELRKKNDEIDVMIKSIAKEKDATRKAALQQQLRALEAARTKLETERKTAKTAKELSDSARATAREDKLKKQKVVGLKQRGKWSLRSVWLRDVIKYMEEDQKKVAALKKAGAAIKMPTAV